MVCPFSTFLGLAQSGCWGCFDEFNRINIEVLSVVAQQIFSILNGLSNRLTKIMFDGDEIKLASTVAIFITMNPGYAGRTELPDNLKSMFRPISMIVPDDIIIAENLLYSDGFLNSKVLAKKVCTLYSLAKLQLSKQFHYDFGLRSMVSLLRYAGVKRRLLSHLNEDQVVYTAIKDMNYVKLTFDDLPLFDAIVLDILPEISIPEIKYNDLEASIRKQLKIMGLQPIPNIITKIIQLYEMKLSRHSVIILGDTCTAKSVTWKVLQVNF
jgi:dynein heavy chain, axonemal